MWKSLSPKNGSHLRNACLRLTTAGALSLMLAVTAGAYTLVFRDGRRIEIPSVFTVTKTTLTYEISPGFNKTMQLILIDVAATERANNEQPGGFFKHAEEQSTVVSYPVVPATKTLTNRDLAAFRQRRIESEQAYEKRRVELGLPTVEETRRRQSMESADLRERQREKFAVAAREEAYWRERARELRTEIATVDAGISYLRGRVSELNESSLANRSWVTGIYPIWPNNRRLGYPQFPNGPLGGYRPARPIYGLGFPYPYGYPSGVYGYPSGPFDNFENSSEQADLAGRLDDLRVRRAGLMAQWRALEDEARDARVPQVWLEP
jgi:hypothetical protein